MDEKKQTEEMAKDIKASLIHHFPKTILYPYIAQDMYALGYRNCKDKVVLTREEYSDYLILQQNHEFIREKAKELQTDNERLYKNLGKFKDSVRKETAREILKEVGKVCGDYTWFKNLCKQYGVEVQDEE